MLEGRGKLDNIVCPLHRWTYDLKGELLGAPRFAENPCVKLHSTPLTNWQGMLFAGPRDPRKDMADFGCSEDFDFSGYVLDRIETTDYATNWKTFVEVYLECYHVDFLHAGLGNYADCDNYPSPLRRVQLGAGDVGEKGSRRPRHAGVPQMAGSLPAATARQDAKYGALWATYFPASRSSGIRTC